MRTLIFDTETTDLVQNSLRKISEQPRIVEFYGLVLEDGAEVEELEFLCNPGISIPITSQKITGITDEMVSKLPKFSYYAGDVKKIIESCDEVVAHNFLYDHFIVQTEFDRIHSEVIWPERRICTVEASEWYRGYRLNLSALYEILVGKTFSDAHRARNDVKALAECFKIMREREHI